MATVIGVRFKRAGKVYYFDPGEVWPRPDMDVVVETSRGIELGKVVTGAREVDDEQIVAPLKQVIRIATEEDVRRDRENEQKEREAHRICVDKIAQHKLEMKLVSVEYAFDGSKIIFYFTANGRVDFRELVKDLASVFKMRIELRQIGVRDEAKMLGGLGSCGRPICCGAFLGDFQPVSIKMAKEQNLSLNPTKISGQCGRLMCCLKYEQDQYEEILKKVPKVGREVMTEDGAGTITEINVIKESVKLRMRTADDSYEIREYKVDDVRRLTPEEHQAEQEAKQASAEAAAARQEANRLRQEKREAEEAARAEKREKKRLPRPKVVRNMNTEEFIASMEGGNGVNPRKPEETEESAEMPVQEEAPRAEKSEKPGRERRDRGERRERSEKPERGDKPVRSEKPERQERGEKPERNDRPEGRRFRGRRREDKPAGGENKPAGGKPASDEVILKDAPKGDVLDVE